MSKRPSESKPAVAPIFRQGVGAAPGEEAILGGPAGKAPEVDAPVAVGRRPNVFERAPGEEAILGRPAVKAPEAGAPVRGEQSPQRVQARGGADFSAGSGFGAGSG